MCNICMELIENDKIVRLKCNPDKHFFCKSCIVNWFKEVQKNKCNSNEYKCRMCPMCRGDGGYLKLGENDKFIKGIFEKEKVKKENNNNENIGNCIHKLKGDKNCSRKGSNKYNGYCGQHYFMLMKKGKINNNSNSQNTTNTINTQNTPNTTNNQKINFSELEQLELGLNEVSSIYDEYNKMWEKYSNEDKINQKSTIIYIFEELKEQILTLLNLINIMMEENDNKDENIIIKLIDNQLKILQLEEKINIFENELLIYDNDNELLNFGNQLNNVFSVEHLKEKN